MTFHADVGYPGTADNDVDVDVEVVGSTTARNTWRSGATFGIGAKVTF